MPTLVYLNCNGVYNPGQSVNASKKGVVTIAGCDANVLKTLAEGGALSKVNAKTGKMVAVSPIESMVTALTGPRYMPIIMTVLKHHEVLALESAQGPAPDSGAASAAEPVDVEAIAAGIRAMFTN